MEVLSYYPKNKNESWPLVIYSADLLKVPSLPYDVMYLVKETWIHLN